ncbi:hypothetical protein SAMN02787142_7139 [Burkholderia sp. WP9]|nr:hypothetical protein SAMN02787142_7139 [Burkholderia sp. WP9]
MSAVVNDVLTYVRDPQNDDDPQETAEWLGALDGVIEHVGMDRAHFLIQQQIEFARANGEYLPFSASTPYINTIPTGMQKKIPGDQAIEHTIRSYTRWNAIAMVLRAGKETNVGGHIASFASAATLYDVGFNHFWHAASDDHGGDLLFFQGHSSPGMYSRAFLEGRLTESQLENFRQEVGGQGMPSYPHPWLMPDFWQFPTVSMGLGPIMSIYQARFMKYILTFDEHSKEYKYMHARRHDLGGYLPSRRRKAESLPTPALSTFEALLKGSGEGRGMSTTMAFVRFLNIVLKDKALGKRVVPIVPDESRTFGMEGLFRQIGIWNQDGQKYEPEDSGQLMFYRESETGQILQEGINEAGGMSDWIAAATSYSTHGEIMIPFYIFYSMFGFQRIGDLAWAAGTCAHAASCLAARQVARRLTAKACSTKMAIPFCGRRAYPIVSAMTRHLATSSRSSPGVRLLVVLSDSYRHGPGAVKSG